MRVGRGVLVLAIVGRGSRTIVGRGVLSRVVFGPRVVFGALHTVGFGVFGSLYLVVLIRVGRGVLVLAIVGRGSRTIVGRGVLSRVVFGPRVVFGALQIVGFGVFGSLYLVVLMRVGRGVLVLAIVGRGSR